MKGLTCISVPIKMLYCYKKRRLCRDEKINICICVYQDALPLLAKEYGFEYELVQYKWPRWLHQQSEKQRIIWGYKILFLDVLFPLDIKKIIFVDADQVPNIDLLICLCVFISGLGIVLLSLVFSFLYHV